MLLLALEFIFEILGLFLLLIHIHNQRVIVARLTAVVTSTAARTCALVPGPVFLETGALRGPMSALGAGVPHHPRYVEMMPGGGDCSEARGGGGACSEDCGGGGDCGENC